MNHLETLKLYQDWRRGHREETMDELGLTAYDIGHALDYAIKFIEENKNEAEIQKI